MTAQVTFTVDQHAVAAFGAHRPNPPLGIAIRPRRLRRLLHHRDAHGGEDLIEDGSELAVPIADQETEHCCSLTEVDQEIAGLLSSPGAGRVGGHAQDVDAPRTDFHHEQHVQALQKDRVNMEEIAGQKPLGLGARRPARKYQDVEAPGRRGVSAARAARSPR